MQRTIVVHGVGGTTPGVVAGAVASLLGLRQGSVETVWSEGHEFIEVTDQERARSVLEVNWSDLNSVQDAVGVLRYAAYILTSMVDVAAKSNRSVASCYQDYSLDQRSVPPQSEPEHRTGGAN